MPENTEIWKNPKPIYPTVPYFPELRNDVFFDFYSFLGLTYYIGHGTDARAE